MTQKPPSTSATEHSHLLRELVLSCLGCGIWVALWWTVSIREEPVPDPFACWDIALVWTISWTPVGFLVAKGLPRYSRWLPALFVTGLVFSAILAGSSSLPWEVNPFFSRWFWGAFVGLSAVILVQSFQRCREPNRFAIRSLSLLLVFIPLITIVASAYTAERIRYHEKKIGEYLSQYRLMEAREILARLKILDPDRKVNNRPLFLLTRDLDQELDSLREEASHLRTQLANASGRKPAEAERLRIQLAQNLAILGRRDKAIADLTALTQQNPQNARALNLLATMWEHQENWEESLRYRKKAKNRLLQRSASPEQTSELVMAWKGIAYAQRKQGCYREAEAAYQTVLEIAPSAEHHFLMAQFYEDAQQGEKAQFHADQAAKLNPPSFRERADQLVDGMRETQFGCWSIFRNQQRGL